MGIRCERFVQELEMGCFEVNAETHANLATSCAEFAPLCQLARDTGVQSVLSSLIPLLVTCFARTSRVSLITDMSTR